MRGFGLAAGILAISIVVKLAVYAIVARRLIEPRSTGRGIALAISRGLLGWLLGLVASLAFAKLLHLATIEPRDMLALYVGLLPARVLAWWVALRAFGVRITPLRLVGCTALSYAIDGALVGIALGIGGLAMVVMIATHIGTC